MLRNIINSQGQRLRVRGPNVIADALASIFGPNQPPDDYILLTDIPGNELQIASSGSLRLTYADNPNREYGLKLQDINEIQQLCEQFAAGDLENFKRYPWQNELPPDSGRNLMEPLETTESAADDLATSRLPPPLPEPAKLSPPCSRCGITMDAGTVKSYRERLNFVPDLASFFSPGLAITAYRCPACGHVELFTDLRDNA